MSSAAFRKASICDLVPEAELRRALALLKEKPGLVSPRIEKTYGDALKEAGFAESEYNAAVLVLAGWQHAFFEKTY